MTPAHIKQKIIKPVYELKKKKARFPNQRTEETGLGDRQIHKMLKCDGSLGFPPKIF